MNLDYFTSLIKRKDIIAIKALIWKDNLSELPTDFALQIFHDDYLREHIIYSKEAELVVELFKKLSEKMDFELFKLLKNEVINQFITEELGYVIYLISEDFKKDEISQLFKDINYEPILNANMEDHINLLD